MALEEEQWCSVPREIRGNLLQSWLSQIVWGVPAPRLASSFEREEGNEEFRLMNNY